MAHTRSSHPVLALVAAIGLSAAGTAAQAHAHLVSATPAADATVSSPKALSLTFSETLEPKFSGVELTTAHGKTVPLATSVSAKDHMTITGALSAPLAPGGYKVMWHVVSSDGHRMKGAFAFTVR